MYKIHIRQKSNHYWMKYISDQTTNKHSGSQSYNSGMIFEKLYRFL